jgi:dTDP-4-amino-4,6-dideoxygalactose transaminase
MGETTGQRAAVSSGTAALHLAMILAGVKAGDEVLCSTLTFVASANPIVYLGAEPVFLDSESGSWNMDPHLLEEELFSAARRGRLPRAVVLVHLHRDHEQSDEHRPRAPRSSPDTCSGAERDRAQRVNALSATPA